MLPASQTAILEWVAWLSSVKRLQPKAIKSCISYGVKNRFSDPTKEQEG